MLVHNPKRAFRTSGASADEIPFAISRILRPTSTSVWQTAERTRRRSIGIGPLCNKSVGRPLVEDRWFGFDNVRRVFDHKPRQQLIESNSSRCKACDHSG